jgi:hypothetical protein
MSSKIVSSISWIRFIWNAREIRFISILTSEERKKIFSKFRAHKTINYRISTTRKKGQQMEEWDTIITESFVNRIRRINCYCVNSIYRCPTYEKLENHNKYHTNGSSLSGCGYYWVDMRSYASDHWLVVYSFRDHFSFNTIDVAFICRSALILFCIRCTFVDITKICEIVWEQFFC